MYERDLCDTIVKLIEKYGKRDFDDSLRIARQVYRANLEIKKGHIKGPEPIPIPPEFDVMMLAVRNGSMTVTEAAKRLNVSRNTLYKWIRKRNLV